MPIAIVEVYLFQLRALMTRRFSPRHRFPTYWFRIILGLQQIILRIFLGGCPMIVRDISLEVARAILADALLGLMSCSGHLYPLLVCFLETERSLIGLWKMGLRC